MTHGLDTQLVAVMAACLVAWGVASAKLEEANLTAPMIFIAAGLLVTHGPLAFASIGAGSAQVRSLAEITLAVVLFGDASAVDVRKLRAQASLPVRLLLIGLPLTVLLGTVAARLLIPSLSIWVCAVIGASIAPTDAALGAPVVEDPRVPADIRRVLNVESGLNDGIVAPFVSFFLAIAVGETFHHAPNPLHALGELALGGLVGLAAGGGGGWLLELAQRRRWSNPAYRPLAVTALSLLAYGTAVQWNGNGFVAAFVAGLAFGTVSHSHEGRSPVFEQRLGELLSFAVWFVFGAAVVPALEAATWQDVVYALLVLTVARIIPVAIALLGAGLDRRTVVFIGWFGPRGLASVVFSLLAYDALADQDGRVALTVITLTVVFSVVLHGASALPLIRRYQRAEGSTSRASPGKGDDSAQDR